MSPFLQTVIALGIVALAAILLLRSFLRKRKQPGCGTDACSSVTPEIRDLKSRLK
ncbi:MAG TPA: FeoB-associated Cys-rich membrane protein [Opitutaceae bacterium]|nr:FeoB-associated Cys-rich membrane protein [Opitutaceae bacterium]